jgi:hypothetical protein
MRLKFIKPVFGLILLSGTIFSFQNCSSNFEGLLEGDSQSSLGRLNFNAEDFRATKDSELSQLQQNCTDPGYENFKCLSKVLRTKEGLDYPVTFRWNRDGLESKGTVIWVLGNNGKGQWRVFPGAVPIQDDFDRNKNIRSVEIDFTEAPKFSINDGGYWKHGGGYYSAAQAYMAAVAYVTANLKSGAFMNHVGGSNGTMVAAYALSHFGAGQYVDRFILHAGPFLPNLMEACDTKHFASFSISPATYNMTLGFLGTWTYLDPSKIVCSDSSAATISRLSVLKDATKSYPQNGIHVIMGAKEKTDGFGDWILESNFSWYSQIEAAEKNREVLETLGHEMHWPSVASYASRSKPAPMGAAPSLTFSASRDGAPITSAALSSKVYGTIRGSDATLTKGCMAESSQISDCENPHKWLSFPNSDWTFDGSVWRSEFTPAQLGLAAGKTYTGFNVNGRTGQRTALVSFQVVADPSGEVTNVPPRALSPPQLTFSKTLGGASSSSYTTDELIYGSSKNLPRDGVKACMQESSQFYLCNDPKNWQSLPNSDWSYVNGEWKAQLNIRNAGALAGKTYIGFHVNTATGERTPNSSFTITAAPPVNPGTPQPPPAAVVPPISEGLFMTGTGIYYSNGSAYCYFGSMAHFTKSTGRTDVTGIRQVSSIPSSMRNDGTCQ